MVREANWVKGTTQVVGIIGHPVRHSLSPAMHNAAMRACGLDYVYVPFEVAPPALAAAVAGLKALGVAGFNVTIPFKAEVMQHLDEFDESALAAGAVNTVKNLDGLLVGYNTDGDGLVKSLVSEFSFVPRDACVAVVGAGGAARGAVAALCRAGAGRIIIANRSREKAAELVSLMMGRYPSCDLSSVEWGEELENQFPSVDVLINSTSLGMCRTDSPVADLSRLSPAACVYDMVYAPAVTPLLHAARSLGLRNANGLGMLAAQGELAFAIWTGRLPPDGLMKGLLDGICNT